MQKYITPIFTDKEGYGLSQYNIAVCTQQDEKWKIMSKLRPEECERRIFMPSEARLEIFLKKYEIKALKFIV